MNPLSNGVRALLAAVALLCAAAPSALAGTVTVYVNGAGNAPAAGAGVRINKLDSPGGGDANTHKFATDGNGKVTADLPPGLYSIRVTEGILDNRRISWDYVRIGAIGEVFSSHRIDRSPLYRNHRNDSFFEDTERHVKTLLLARDDDGLAEIRNELASTAAEHSEAYTALVGLLEDFDAAALAALPEETRSELEQAFAGATSLEDKRRAIAAALARVEENVKAAGQIGLPVTPGVQRVPLVLTSLDSAYASALRHLSVSRMASRALIDMARWAGEISGRAYAEGRLWLTTGTSPLVSRLVRDDPQFARAFREAERGAYNRYAMRLHGEGEGGGDGGDGGD